MVLCRNGGQLLPDREESPLCDNKSRGPTIPKATRPYLTCPQVTVAGQAQYLKSLDREVHSVARHTKIQSHTLYF